MSNLTGLRRNPVPGTSRPGPGWVRNDTSSKGTARCVPLLNGGLWGRWVPSSGSTVVGPWMSPRQPSKRTSSMWGPDPQDRGRPDNPPSFTLLGRGTVRVFVGLSPLSGTRSGTQVHPLREWAAPGRCRDGRTDPLVPGRDENRNPNSRRSSRRSQEMRS